MSENSTSSVDNIKLVVAGLGLFAICFTGVGIVPVGILVIGFAIALKGGDIKNVIVTTRFIQICGAAIGGGFLFAAAYQHIQTVDAVGTNPSEISTFKDVSDPQPMAYNITDDEATRQLRTSYLEAKNYYESSIYKRNRNITDRNIMAFIALIFIVLAYLLDLIWLKPITRSLDKFRTMFPTYKPKQRAKAPNIMAREALSGYSAADELIKWGKMRDDGLISDAEFQNARAKILGTR
jgi:hypothetical protein